MPAADIQTDKQTGREREKSFGLASWLAAELSAGRGRCTCYHLLPAVFSLSPPASQPSDVIDCCWSVRSRCQKCGQPRKTRYFAFCHPVLVGWSKQFSPFLLECVLHAHFALPLARSPLFVLHISLSPPSSLLPFPIHVRTPKHFAFPAAVRPLVGSSLGRAEGGPIAPRAEIAFREKVRSPRSRSLARSVASFFHLIRMAGPHMYTSYCTRHQYLKQDIFRLSKDRRSSGCVLPNLKVN